MKKLLLVLLVLCLIGSLSCAFAEAPGVVVISGGDVNSQEPICLDDVKLNTPVEIPGYGTFTLTLAERWENVGQGAGNSAWYSGKEADYFVIQFDVLNTTTTSHDYAADVTDIVSTYKDDVVYGGWGAMQYNFDDNSSGPQKSTWAIDAFYVGHYILGVTLPNAILDDTKNPLRLEFKLGDNEITYNIRK